MNGGDLVAEHARLGREARRHKREAARHREKAKGARQRQSQIEEECRRRGIAVITRHEGEGRPHGR